MIGLGGGMALDHAKLSAGLLGLPLILVPSILSVDAGFTRATGVREDGRVRYVGDCSTVLKAILIDYALLESAPAVLNRAGAGDILSCFTGLWDWADAGAVIGEDFDRALADTVQSDCLDKLYDNATELKNGTEAGYKLLAELFAEEVRLCERWGNSRLEEGSEHYIAYALEAVSGKHYIHGQLVGLCIILAAYFQGQDSTRVVKCIADLGLDCSFKAVGTDRAELARVLASMPSFVVAEADKLAPGVFHTRYQGAEKIPADLVEAALDHAERCFPPSP